MTELQHDAWVAEWQWYCTEHDIDYDRYSIDYDRYSSDFICS